MGFLAGLYLAKKEKRRAQQIGKRIDDPIALAGIMKRFDHPRSTSRVRPSAFDRPIDGPRASHGPAKHHGPRFPGQPLGSGIDVKGLVERGTKQR